MSRPLSPHHAVAREYADELMPDAPASVRQALGDLVGDQMLAAVFARKTGADAGRLANHITARRMVLESLESAESPEDGASLTD